MDAGDPLLDVQSTGVERAQSFLNSFPVGAPKSNYVGGFMRDAVYSADICALERTFRFDVISSIISFLEHQCIVLFPPPPCFVPDIIRGPTVNKTASITFPRFPPRCVISTVRRKDSLYSRSSNILDEPGKAWASQGI